MKYLVRYNIRYKLIFFFACALLCSNVSKGQSRATESLLQLESEKDIDDEDEKAEEDDNSVNLVEVQNFNTRKLSLARFVFGDIGTSSLKYDYSDVNSTANGYSFALCGQLGLRIDSKNENTKTLITTGLEFRNFNCSYAIEDNAGLTRNYCHYWYMGVPVYLTVYGAKHTPGSKNDLNFYGQIGLTMGVKMAVSQLNEGGTNATVDISNNYNSLVLQPFVSAGITYTTNGRVCLIGPFYGYSLDNMSNLAGAKESVQTYGVRLTAMLFKK